MIYGLVTTLTIYSKFSVIPAFHSYFIIIFISLPILLINIKKSIL